MPTSNTATTLTVTTLGSSGTTSVTFIAPAGSAYSTVAIDAGSGLSSSHICSGAAVLGISGWAACPASHAFHDVGSLQLSAYLEAKSYAGTALPSTLGYTYRDVPELLKDDDGSATSDNGCVADCTGIQTVTVSQHTNFVDCGVSQATILERIADCASSNSTPATWNGLVRSNGGHGVWKLVSRNGANQEVWKDMKTGLLWSTKSSTAPDWCAASGNDDAADPSGFCGANTQSYCAETRPCGSQPERLCRR